MLGEDGSAKVLEALIEVNTFCRRAANAVVLSASLRAQPLEGFVIGKAVSVGG